MVRGGTGSRYNYGLQGERVSSTKWETKQNITPNATNENREQVRCKILRM